MARRIPSTQWACRLAGLNGAVSRLNFAAFRLVPNYQRSRNLKVVPVTQIVDSGDLENLGEDDDEGVENGDGEEF